MSRSLVDEGRVAAEPVRVHVEPLLREVRSWSCLVDESIVVAMAPRMLPFCSLVARGYVPASPEVVMLTAGPERIGEMANDPLAAASHAVRTLVK